MTESTPQHPPAQPKSKRQKSLDESTSLILGSKLWLYILAGMALGIVTGLSLSPSGLGLLSQDQVQMLSGWISLPGVVFISLLKMVIVPLIITSIVLGISSAGDLGFLKQIGVRILPYFILTTMIAITIGMTLSQTIKPGLLVDRGTVDTLLQQEQAKIDRGEKSDIKTFENLTIPQRIANIIPKNPAQAQLKPDMLQLVVFAIFLGICVITLPRTTTQPFTDLCLFGQLASMKVISWAMMIAPIAVFGLLCDITMKIGFDIIISVSAYFLTVLGGLLIMGLTYMLIAFILAGRHPLSFLKDIREAQLLAFSTSSSAAVMPVSIQTAEEKLKVEPKISRFIIPLGATINMDGTALYQAAAAIFLCQIFGIDLSTGEMLLLLLTTVGASIGTPAMPGVGLVVLATILSNIGVPLSGIAIILGVDRLLDMCRTTINVTGDLTASCVMNRWLAGK